MSIALDEIRERAVSVSQGAYRVVRAEDFEALVTEVERLLAQRVLSNEDFSRAFDMGLAAGERRERAAVVAYLRACDGESYDFADDIERGAHRESEEYAIGYNVWKEKS
jgi:hypothetical protein